jgi:hypothetical protein
MIIKNQAHHQSLESLLLLLRRYASGGCVAGALRLGGAAWRQRYASSAR